MAKSLVHMGRGKILQFYIGIGNTLDQHLVLGLMPRGLELRAILYKSLAPVWGDSRKYKSLQRIYLFTFSHVLNLFFKLSETLEKQIFIFNSFNCVGLSFLNGGSSGLISFWRRKNVKA